MQNEEQTCSTCHGQQTIVVNGRTVACPRCGGRGRV